MILNEQQKLTLKKNQASLHKLSIVDANFQNLILIPTEVENILTWKIFNPKIPSHFFYLPSDNYQKHISSPKLQYYSKGITTELIETVFFSEQKEELEQLLKPYFNLKLEQSYKIGYHNHKPEMCNFLIHFIQAEDIIPNLLYFKLNLFRIKKESLIDNIKTHTQTILRSNSNNIYCTYYQEMLAHIELVEEKIKLEQIISPKNGTSKINKI